MALRSVVCQDLSSNAKSLRCLRNARIWNKRSSRKLQARHLHHFSSHRSDGWAGVAAAESIWWVLQRPPERCQDCVRDVTFVVRDWGVQPGHLIGAVIKCLGGYELIYQKRHAICLQSEISYAKLSVYFSCICSVSVQFGFCSPW